MLDTQAKTSFFKAKELICTTHGHELMGGNVGGREGTGWRGIKRRKKWDNCNSIINKILNKKKPTKKLTQLLQSIQSF